MTCSFFKNQRVKSLEFVDKLNIKLTIDDPKFKKIWKYHLRTRSQFFGIFESERRKDIQMDENEEFEDATEEVFNSNVMMSGPVMIL